MQFVNLHTHQFQNDSNVVAIVNQYPLEIKPAEYYSTGIHPWHIKSENIKQELEIIERELTNKSCVAIGECGLDKRIETTIEIQQPIFERQLFLAQQYQKPVIIHCVAAFQELVAIKKTLQISVPMIIHGFSKNIELANQLLDNGFYLSFGKHLIQNPNLGAVLKQIPANRFFLETDSAEIAIEDVYNMAAQYRQQSVESLSEQIIKNFNNVFNCSIVHPISKT